LTSSGTSAWCSTGNAPVAWDWAVRDYRTYVWKPAGRPVAMYLYRRLRLLAASLVVGGLVPRQPGTAWGAAVLDVNWPVGRCAVGDLLPASRAGPGQRRVPVLAAGELPERVLGGGEQQLRAGSPVIR
jgi:hypothetical protein